MRWEIKAINENCSLNKVARLKYLHGESYNTVHSLLELVLQFCKRLRITPDRALASNWKWFDILNNYIEYCLVEKKIARTSVRNKIVNIRQWLRINGVELGGLAYVPHSWTFEKDRIPTREELVKILGLANLRNRLMALISLSSGCRSGTICQLRLRDINLNEACPSILVPPYLAKNRPSNGYITFMTPEAKKMTFRAFKRTTGKGRKNHS